MPATSTRRLKKTEIGPSKSVCALMIKIDWTNAPVVTIKANEKFELKCMSINTKTGEFVENARIAVKVGMVFYFVRSSFGDLYYVGQVSPAGVVGCSCPHRIYKGECKHQEMILAAHNARAEHLRKREAEEFSQAVAALPDQAESAPEMPTECPQDAPEVEPDLLSDEELLQVSSPEDRVWIWRRIAKEERACQKAVAGEYWGKVDELRSQAS